MVDLLELTSSIQIIYIENIIYLFTKTRKLNEEVNSTEPSPTDSIPWLQWFGYA